MTTDSQSSEIFTPGTSDDSAPIGDTERQAIASLRGYTYQVAAAALAWLDLSDGARLYLEVTEDYATLAAQALSAVQVKDTAGSGSITLNTKSVRDAVDAFVVLVAGNPGRAIELRYLSTSPIGTEQKVEDRPAGQAGLLYWRKAAASGDVAPLRTILTSERFSQAVRDFVNARSDDALRRDLLRSIHWDVGQPDLAGVVAELEERLIVLGRNRFHLPAPEARRLRDVVMFQVLSKSVLKQAEERVLTRGDLYAAIDASTCLSLPRAHVEAMAQLLSGALGGGGPVASPFAVTEVGWIVAGRDLPKPRTTITRAALETNISTALKDHGAAVLVGASGLGKSLVARNVAQAQDGDFSLIDLRDLDVDETRYRLDFLFGRVGTLSSHVIIFEDLNHLEHQGVALAFGRVMAALRRRDRTILVTCYRKPTVGSLNRIGVGAEAIIQVPYFSEDESKEVVRASGGAADTWGPVAHAAGGFGHPQLVHAFVVGIAARGWPPTELREIVARGLSSDDIEAAREAARRQLAAQLPEDARRLLYRLSLLTGRFDRPLALSIGAIPPPVSSAGDNLDALVGPWIEAGGQNRYRISPLAAQSGRDNLSPDEQRIIHTEIASHMLRRGEISIADANTVFLHAFAGRFEAGLLALSHNILTSDQEGRTMLAEHFFALRLLRTDRPIYPENPTLSRMLRLAQFRLVAADGKGSEIRSTVAALLAEMSDESDVLSQNRFEALALSVVLITMGIANHLPEWVHLLRRYRAIVEADPELRQGKVNMERAEPLSFYGALFSIGATGIFTVERLEQVVIDLQKIDKDERRLWLQAYEGETLGFSIFVNGPWSAEDKRNAIDAADAALRYKRMAELTKDWGVRALTLQFHVARAVMLDEYSHDRDSALAALDEAQAALGDDIALDRARAKILWRDNNYVEALEIWRRIADRIGHDSPVERASSLREAAINAAKANDWAQAENWFLDAEKGAASSDLDDMKPMAIGLNADAAVAALYEGKSDRALSRLADTLEALGGLDPDTSLRAAYCHRVIRHTALWAQRRIEKVETLIGGAPMVMMPGTCSNPEPPDIKDLPLGQIDVAWYMLAGAEIASGVDVGIYRSLRSRLVRGPIPVLEVEIRNQLLTKELDKLDATGFAERLTGFVEGLAFMKADGQLLRMEWNALDPPRGEIPPLVVDDLVRVSIDALASQAILAFCMAAALSSRFEAIDALEQALIAKLGGGHLGESVLSRLHGNVERSTDLGETVINLIKVMRTGGHIEPLDVWGIARQSGFKRVLIARIGEWLRNSTIRIIAEESFRLSRPMQVIPELEAVLSNDRNEEKFVADLLLKLSDAVSAPLAQAYRDELKNIAAVNTATGQAAASAA